MRHVRHLSAATVICLLGSALWLATPAAAATSITVTPNTALMHEQTVHVEGAGFPPSVELAVGQCTATSSPSDCTGGSLAYPTSSPTGTFSIDLLVYRHVSAVDCLVHPCWVGAAVFDDLENTAAFAPITFAAGQPDGRLKRRNDGVIFGDDVYGFSRAQSFSHTIAPGGTWTYALQVQNDGPDTDSITVSAADWGNRPDAQFFFGYFDVTSLVRGTGLTFPDMAPGEVYTFALRFSAAPGTADGLISGLFVSFRSDRAGTTDTLGTSVIVKSPA